VFTNARIRAVFGGLDYEDAALIANEMFLRELNTRQIKKAYYHTIHLYREETRTISGRSSSQGSGWTSGSGLNEGVSTVPVEGWFASPPGTVFTGESSHQDDSFTTSEGQNEVDVPIFVPIPVQELTSETEWTREEKLSKLVEMLKEQQQRHCFVKIDTAPPQPLKIPFVQRYAVAPDTLQSYSKDAYAQQGALPGADIDRFIEESEVKFLTIDKPGEADGDTFTSPVAPFKPKKRGRKK